MNYEDQNYERALKKYEIAKRHFDKALSQYNLYRGEFKIGEYYSISGIKIDMPFVPSSDNKARIMVDLLGDIKNKKCADLGCGDGKVVLLMLEKGADAYGYELDPKLAKRAQSKLKQYDHQQRRIMNKNFMHADLSQYDCFSIYGITSLMEKLEKKLLKEVRPGTLITSNTFLFHNLKEVRKCQNVYLYQI